MPARGGARANPPQIALVSGVLLAVLGDLCARQHLARNLVATSNDIKLLVRARLQAEGSDTPLSAESVLTAVGEPDILPDILAVLEGRRSLRVADVARAGSFRVIPETRRLGEAQHEHRPGHSRRHHHSRTGLAGASMKIEAAPPSAACLAEILSCPWEAVPRLIPDEQPVIEETLRDLCITSAACLVVTTGGTGPAPRDVTPEATEAVCDKILDGFGEQMRAVSLKVVPTAILSRQIAGIRGQSLIVNLPGKPGAIRDCLLAVFPAVPYCIDLIGGPYLTTHESVAKAFRPKV